MTSPSPRRFPPPWRVVEVAEAYSVQDANGFTLSYTYFDEAERGANSTRMSRDEARRIANGIARLPGLMGALADDMMKRNT
jgi:hypothetical protein